MLEQINPYDKLKKGLGNLIKPFVTLTKMLPENAYIAGGFVRDIYHDKPFKDIDIFIGHGKRSLLYIEIALKEAFGDKIKLEEYNPNENEEYGNAVNIDKVYRVIGAIVPIDIIVSYCNKPTIFDTITNFDLSINQCVITNMFNAYVNTSKTITANTKYGIPDINRIQRLHVKYPELDWTGVLPEPAKVKEQKEKELEAIGDVAVGRWEDLF